MAELIRAVLLEQKMIYEERIAKLLKERDSARRLYCSNMADSVRSYRSPEEIAEDRGWDCYKENKENNNG